MRPSKKKRLRITLLNESYFQKHIIKKGDIVGYLLSPNSNFSIQQHEKKKHKIPANYLLKTWDWKNFRKKNDVNKPADSLAVTILHTLEETQSTR